MIDKHKVAGSDSQAAHRRAAKFDALDAVLPFDRRDQLAELLTDGDLATPKHLASDGMARTRCGRSPQAISLAKSPAKMLATCAREKRDRASPSARFRLQWPSPLGSAGPVSSTHCSHVLPRPFWDDRKEPEFLDDDPAVSEEIAIGRK